VKIPAGESVDTYTFSQSPGYQLYGQVNKKYSTLAEALKTCAKDARCTGVNEELGKQSYYLARETKVHMDSDFNAYVKGGADVKTETFNLAAADFTWEYGKPYTLDRCYGYNRNLNQALKLCGSQARCGGVTKRHNDNRFLLCAGSAQRPKYKSQVWIKQGGGNEYSYKTVWTTYDNFKLTGYFNNKVYKSKKTALAECSKAPTCLGVTKEGRKNFRLNTGSTPFKQRGMKAWVQSGFTTSAYGKSNFKLFCGTIYCR
jgi:hypothetical protein